MKLREEQLSNDLNISRTPIREALRRLEADGLVIHIPNRGTTVRTYTLEDIKHAYNLRALLEGYAAFLAAQNRQEEDMDLLFKANKKYELAVQNCTTFRGENIILEIMEANRFFHDTIIKLSGNKQIKVLLSTLIALPLVYQSFFWYSSNELLISITHHKSIESAIKEKDSEQARALMTTHIYHGRDHVLRHQKIYSNN